MSVGVTTVPKPTFWRGDPTDIAHCHTIASPGAVEDRGLRPRTSYTEGSAAATVEEQGRGRAWTSVLPRQRSPTRAQTVLFARRQTTSRPPHDHLMTVQKAWFFGVFR
jgi:hypothetical protein